MPATQSKSLRRALVEDAAQVELNLARKYAMKAAAKLDELGETERHQQVMFGLLHLEDAGAEKS